MEKHLTQVIKRSNPRQRLWFRRVDVTWTAKNRQLGEWKTGHRFLHSGPVTAKFSTLLIKSLWLLLRNRKSLP